MKIISGTEAIARMRKMRFNKNASFELQHLTYNREKDETQGMRLVSHCRLRPALPKEKFYPHQDIYLPYIDLNLNKKNRNRMCFKKLIRYVAFPPDYEVLKVNWFN